MRRGVHDGDIDQYVPLKRRREELARRAARFAAERGAHSIAQAARDVLSKSDDNINNSELRHLSPRKRPLSQKEESSSVNSSRGASPDERGQENDNAVPELPNKRGLRTATELANDVSYERPMQTTWNPPRYLRDAPPTHHDECRELHHILVDGSDIPPPCLTFREMKLPAPILAELSNRAIVHPSSIQMQGLPVALAGRDMIGMAFTGSGKTLVFTIPLVMTAWQMEKQLPFISGEGPAGVILAPSRELARQTYDIVDSFCQCISQHKGPRLRPFLAIGGTKVDYNALKNGIHMVIATPGRLLHLLRSRRINLDACRYIALDEADRLIDLGFEEDVRDILSFFKAQRQTLMFSATMPANIQKFAASALVKPVVVNVGRAGAASLNITQQVYLVPGESRISRLLEVLQKTAPPALIFCEGKSDVDEIHEYLLGKGVAAVSIHGDRDQEDRDWAMREFRNGRKDVLVATDVAAKGLDFPRIRHVINYDMPEIQTYVHRIGRTGRGDKTGLATTFVRHADSTTLIADLMQLLVEAKQEVPESLYEIVPEFERGAASGRPEGRGCAYCGGLSHKVSDCPVLEKEKMKAIVGGGAGGEGFNRRDTYGGEW